MFAAVSNVPLRIRIDSPAAFKLIRRGSGDRDKFSLSSPLLPPTFVKQRTVVFEPSPANHLILNRHVLTRHQAHDKLKERSHCTTAKRSNHGSLSLIPHLEVDILLSRR